MVADVSDNPLPLLELVDLKHYYPFHGGFSRRVISQVRALDGVDLALYPGEAVGLAGESGCGKTTLGRTVLRLIGPTSGKIFFSGQDISSLKSRDLGPLRADIQMVFQDPYSSLDPRMRVKDLVAEPLILQKRLRGKAMRDEVLRLLDLVGLNEKMSWRFPRDLSGGQRQRVAVARTLALKPKLVILDEPTSALDVSVQTQVLNLFVDLQEQLSLTYLFISHDLGVIRYLCDRIAILYMGRIVESGTTADIFRFPAHPYTQALMSIMSEPGKKLGGEIILKGDVFNNLIASRSCRFANRCFASKLKLCDEQEPALVDIGAGHQVACYLYHNQSIG
jgi:oligopeptide/dipeptide ABC transporter ATP-binding protein